MILKNVRYTVDTLGQLPDDLQPKKFCRKSDNSTLVFGGVLSEHDTFSNWSPSRIAYGDHVYGCLEQAYMHTKNNGEW